MDKLNDEIHRCNECSVFPCTEQEFVESSVCNQCPSHCCRAVVIPLLPCEKTRFYKLRCKTAEDYNRLNEDWCPYYNQDKKGCLVYNIRPIVCRIASCRFIREGRIPVWISTL